ncbi:MAG: DUF2442 domain-containing protein [Oscillospiraceae bacterium]|nr:DUF2442 domain-containing protein [Oscillospiraceae bacterium]
MFEQNGIIYAGEPGAPIAAEPDVIEVKPLEDYTLWLRFEDGRELMYDVKPHLNGKVYAPLKDVRVFNSVYVDYGTAVWLDGRVDIAPESLYEKGVPAPQVA